MLSKTSKKFNLPVSTTYIEMPLDFTGRTAQGKANPFYGLLCSAQFMLGLIHTMNKIYNEPSKITYSDFMCILGIGSKETVSNALRSLIERGLIEEVKQSHYEIKAAYNKKDYLKVDEYLFRTEFKVGDTEKRLTRSSIKAFALIDRANRNPKTNGVFISSQARIGKAVGLPRTTAGDSIREISAVALCSCEKAPDSYGASKRGLYIYKIAPEVLAVRRCKPKSSEPVLTEPREKLYKSKGEGQELRVLIERHFSELRHTAESRAERVLAKATADREYSAIAAKLNEIAFNIAVTSITDPDKALKLEKEHHRLEVEGDKRLIVLGINKADFSPRYSCQICNDTGYDLQGKPCKCLNKFIQAFKNKT